MNKEHGKELLNSFSELYSEAYRPPTESLMCFGWEHGDGWFEIIKKLSEKLTTLIKSGDCPNLKAVQVKEKFGGLRFYTNFITDESEKVIDEAEKEASKTCELCGNKGELHHRGGWLKTLCSQCAQPLEYVPAKDLTDHNI